MSRDNQGISVPVAIGIVVAILAMVSGLGIFIGNKVFWKPAETRTFQDKKFDQIAEAYQKSPKSPQAKLAYALLLHSQKEDKKAEKLYTELVKDFPKDNSINTNYAIFLMDINRKAEAEKVFKKVLDRAPYFEVADLQYGILLREDGRFKDALERFDKALSMDPGAADILLEKARVYVGMKDKVKAKEFVNAALRYYPTYDDAKKLLKELE